MIIRKPYAFLIKNFKKIHIAMLLLSIFVFFKLIDVSRFVAAYMKDGVYDSYANPITKHITFILSLSIILIFIGCGALIFLLRYKKKPWKLYLIPFIEYFALYFVLKMIKSFFVGYTYDVETTDLRMSRDLLFTFQFLELPAIAIFVMRVFGIDIQKFNFNSDKEFFELSEKDREEIEISLSFDKNSFIRLYKRLFRNIGYVYTEHKNICKVIIVIFSVIFLFSGFKFIFVTNKVYHQGSNYRADGFTFKVNNVYFTDKDAGGEVISKKSNFVIVDMTVTNNSAPQKINMDKFHLKNSNYDYTTTKGVYASEFKDLGNVYDSVTELKRGEQQHYIVIYKVANKLRKGRFVLYYQERFGHLRKITINVKDISKIKENKETEFGTPLKVSYKGEDREFVFESAELVDESIEYYYRKCNVERCQLITKKYECESGYDVLAVSFSSNDFEGKDLFDFSNTYGKIVYIDSEGKERVQEFKYPFGHFSTDKVLYTLVPENIKDAKKVDIVYTLRNQKYVYKIS